MNQNNGFGITSLSEAMAYMTASQQSIADKNPSPQQSPDSSAHKEHPLGLKSLDLPVTIPPGM